MSPIDLFAGLFVLALGLRAMTRALGAPWTVEGLRRWVLVLVVLAVLFAGRHDLAAVLSAAVPPTASGGAGIVDTILLLALLALGVWGYRQWTLRAERAQAAHERHERARQLPRRRALPPAPQ